MKFNYDKQSDALSIRFNDELYCESDEVSEGVIIDYDKAGRMIGMEILGASRKMPQEFGAFFSREKLPVIFDVVRA